jgi:membrane peptidoglycan carboxypeptidase
MTDSPPPNGASTPWHEPDVPGMWRELEQPDTSGGWRVPAVPTDIQDEPAETGGWHRPAADDTRFTAEDKLDIRPEDEQVETLPEDAESIAPEDMAPRPVAPEDDILPPEDIAPPEDTGAETPPEDEPKDLLAPEDLLHMIEQSDDTDDDDDFNTVGWSELVALASLADDETQGNIEQGQESPISADLALASSDSLDDDDVDIQMLSPAERMVMGEDASGETEEVEAEVINEDDPAAYARQQMQALQGGDQPGDDVAEDDPAAYARQQMQALQGGGDLDMDETGFGSSTQPVEAAQDDPGSYAQQQLQALQGGQPAEPQAPREELSPRDVDLLQKFRQVEQNIGQLRQQYRNGQLSQEDYTAALRDQMIRDDDQNWWIMGVDDDNWYKSENGQWVPATPDVYEKEQRVQGQQTGDYGSLPYLPDDQPQGTAPSYGEYSQPAQDDPYSDMPLPKQVPHTDPEATVPSQSVFNMETQPVDPGATVPSSAYNQATVPSERQQEPEPYQPTVMATPVDYGAIESPYDRTEPPEYAIDEGDEGEVYAEARERQRASTSRVAILITVIAVGLVFLFIGGFIGIASLWYQNESEQWAAAINDVQTGAVVQSFEPVILLDSDGNEIAELTREGDLRRAVEITEVSPYFVHALLTVEQAPDYYERSEWGFVGTLDAFRKSLLGGDLLDGVSPITIAVIDALVLRDSPLAGDERELAQAIIANEMAVEFTDAELLEYYFNELLFFGNQTYGVEAAADYYFDKPAADLTFPEAALLVSILADPAAFEPIGNRELALDRMEEVMDAMAAQGCIQFEDPLPAGGVPELCVSESDLDSPQTAADRGRVIRFLRTQAETEDLGEYPHFVTLVRNQLEAAYGNAMYQGGYVVTTTLDSTVQDVAQNAIAQQVVNLNINGVDTGAAMVTDPRNGAILALVGSPNYNNDEINGQEDKGRTYQQPGDIMEPIVYAMALQGIDSNGNGLEQGEYVTPVSILYDVYTEFSDGTPIQNQGGRTFGAVPLRFALGNSLNTPVVKLFRDYGGAERLRAYGEELGIRWASEEVIIGEPTALGATEVRLYDMMEAYGTFANDGRITPLRTINSIVDSSGNDIAVAPELQSEAVQVIPPGVAFFIQDILSDNNARQPIFPANSPLTVPGVDAAAVSATTSNSRDLWTMGFTSNRVVGVWLGSNNDSGVLNDLTGFVSASPVWNEIMRTAIQGTETAGFTIPPDSNVLQGQVCADTGTAPPGPTCPTIVNAFFLGDRRPPPPEQGLTVQRQIDAWSGLIANQFCPDNVITETFVNIDDPWAFRWLNQDPSGRAYANRIGIPLPAIQPPSQACTIDTVIPVARIASPQGGQTIQGSVSITGQVSAPDFARYEVQYGPVGGANFTTITSSTQAQPNANSTLATWDTTGVPDGEYTIRLAVFANNNYGGVIFRTANVTLDNPEPTPTPTPTLPPPTNTPLPQPTAPPVVPTDPLPFDPITEQPPAGPSPTIDPLGG